MNHAPEINPPAVVQRAEETEQQLVQRAQAAVTQSNWVIGECASAWTQQYARGRTDKEFADLIGTSQQRVNDARLVFDRFESYRSSGNFTFTHFRVALAWDDAQECLRWAGDMGASVAEMKAWRRAQHGEDLTQPPAAPTKSKAAPEPDAAAAETESAAVQDTPRETGKSGPAPGPANRNPASSSRERSRGSGNARNSPPPPASAQEPQESTVLSMIQKVEKLIGAKPETERRKLCRKLRAIDDKLDPRHGHAPTLEEVQEYVVDKGYEIDVEAFWHFYEANGWVQGKSGKPIKKWQSAVETWRRMRLQFDAPQGGKTKAQQRSENNSRVLDQLMGDDW